LQCHCSDISVFESRKKEICFKHYHQWYNTESFLGFSNKVNLRSVKQAAKREIDKNAIGGTKNETLLKRMLAALSKQGRKEEEMGKRRKTIQFVMLK